jgi:hypothetical protein
VLDSRRRVIRPTKAKGRRDGERRRPPATAQHWGALKPLAKTEAAKGLINAAFVGRILLLLNWGRPHYIGVMLWRNSRGRPLNAPAVAASQLLIPFPKEGPLSLPRPANNSYALLRYASTRRSNLRPLCHIPNFIFNSSQGNCVPNVFVYFATLELV